MWNIKEWMHGKKGENMYHRGVIVAWCVIIVNGGDVGLLMWVCGVVQSSWSYKADGALELFDPTTHLLPSSLLLLLLAMSLINNCTFEHSMGHQISWEDACFHLHTSDRQHYPSNQQVGCPIEVGLSTSMTCSSSGSIWWWCARVGTTTGYQEWLLMISFGIKLWWWTAFWNCFMVLSKVLMMQWCGLCCIVVLSMWVWSINCGTGLCGEILPGQQRQEGLGQQGGEIERRAQVKDQLCSKEGILEAWGVLRRREIARRGS